MKTHHFSISLRVALIMATLMSLALTVPRTAIAELRPTLHELDTIAAAGGPRRWYHEEEFHRDRHLRAEPHQVVILHLEPTERRRQGRAKGLTKGRTTSRNTIPYRFAETADYTFCIPKDDPHIRSLELRREGKSRGMVVRVPRGAPCKTHTIKAGLYQLHVEHDGSRIGAGGEKAFLQVPQAQTNFPSCNDYPFFDDALILFTDPNGSFVVGADGEKIVTRPTPLDDGLFGVWSICHDDSGNFTIFEAPGGPPHAFVSSGPPSSDQSFYLRDLSQQISATPLKLTDLGNGRFTLAANFDGTLYPIVVGADGVLRWAESGAATTFAIALKVYEAGVVAPPLQPGETALFQACNYDSSVSGTWVFNASFPDLGLFLDDAVAAAKVGPQTVATLYANPNFSGTSQVIGADTPCLSGTPLGVNTASSLKIAPARQFVASSGSCQYCNLSGVDLSGLDLTGGSFQGSTFTGANLADTNFQGAILDHAKIRSYSSEGGPTILAGTDFLAAHLNCTDFQASDLRQAFFSSTGPPPILPIITKDFSCRVQLQYATLTVNTFPVSDWRYFILNGAAITGASGQVLSTTTQPLDLSKALLSGTTGLTHVDLTGANIAAADFTGTDLTGTNLHSVTSVDPTTHVNSPALFTNAKLDGATLDYATLDGAQLTGASLVQASLRRVSLANALLQGAVLSSTNLDGANFCSAKLNRSPSTNISANLEGAFLRNVNLSMADLTGATLADANFYSSSPNSTSVCNPEACGFNTTCASAVNAHLDNVDFSGAYLAGVDFSGSFAQAADFRNAFLAGSNLSGVDLTQDSDTGKAANLEGTFLQGTNFSDAKVAGVNFNRAVVDLTNPHGQTLRIQLDVNTHLTFPGYTPHADSTPGCAQFSTTRETTLPPTTDSTNICPDNKQGMCSAAQWQAITPPGPSSCSRDSNWTSVIY